MRQLVVSLALVLSACGAPKEPAKPAEHVATVAAPEPDSETDDKTAPGSAPERDGSGAEGCTAGLRSASDLGAAGEERVLYDAGLAAERGGDAPTARKTYFELIQKHPTSKLIPLAYLAFGELFSVEAESDPTKWELAKASYREVIKYPPPDNVAYFYALLRLGAADRGDPSQALSDFAKASEVTKLHPSSPCASAIADQAREGMVRAFAEAGAPDKAWAFFRAKLGEREGADAMRSLVRSYRGAGKKNEACAAAKGASNLPELGKEGCAP